MKISFRSFLVAIVPLLALSAKATTWSDALVSAVAGPTMSSTIGTDGYAQLVWFSGADGTLHYAYQDGGGFHTVSFTAANVGVSGIDGSGLEGIQLGIAVDSNNVPHLAFGVSEAGGVSGARGVWYGTYNGSGSILSASNWTFHRVAAYTNGNGWLNVYTVAIAMDPTVNRPAVAWFLSDSNNPRSSTLYYSTRASDGSWPGSGSLISTSASTPPAPASGMVVMAQFTGSFGDDVYGPLSFAVSSNGKHAFTCPALDPTTGNFNQLLAGTDISGSWVTRTLQSISNASTLTVSSAVAFDPNNLPRVVWGDLRDNSTNLETTPDGASWTNTVVMSALQSASSYGVGVSYAINSGFVELIASEESTMADGTAPWVIRTATRSGGSGSWTVQTAVSTSDAAVLGYEIAPAVDSSNNAIIGYDIGEESNSAGSVRLLTGVISFGAVPTVTMVSPNSGTTAGSTSVTLTGTNFIGATAVEFGTNSRTGLTINGPTSITVNSPAGTASTVDIKVTNTAGTSAAVTADHFTYEAVPTVTGLSVSSGPVTGATSVTLTGTGFIGATAVLFGSANATSVVVNGATSITVDAPSGTAGTEDVTVVAPGEPRPPAAPTNSPMRRLPPSAHLA